MEAIHGGNLPADTLEATSSKTHIDTIATQSTINKIENPVFYRTSIKSMEDGALHSPINKVESPNVIYNGRVSAKIQSRIFISPPSDSMIKSRELTDDIFNGKEGINNETTESGLE